MFLSHLLFLFTLSAVCASNADICDVFKDVSCELSEDNIVGLDRHTNTPGECQEKCLLTAGCEWFEHFGTGCYLLRECGHEEQCGGCVSGPNSPEYATCAPQTTTTQATTTTGSVDSSCSDFEEASCELEENNIIDYDRLTNTAGECQAKCRDNLACSWFTFFESNCYLLSNCGTTEHCEGCVSGPTTPDVTTCPWPPGPNPDTTTSMKTSTASQTTTITTTPTTTSSTKTTTTITTITTTTITTTTTTTPAFWGDCDDIHVNEECDWDHGLVQWYENVMTGSQCQHICKNIHDANFFSHYNEGHEAEIGVCGCFSACIRISKDGCNAICRTSTQEVSIEDFLEAETYYAELDSSETFGGELEVENIKDPRPGPVYCHCMHGPLDPDVDTCDLWP